MDEYISQQIPVPAEYQNVFSHFYFAQNLSGTVITKTLLPSFQTILIITFGPPAIVHSAHSSNIEIHKCAVLGPIKQAFQYSLPPSSEILVVNFVHDAFYRFFAEALIADTPLEESCFLSLWAKLNSRETLNERIDYLLSFCEPYLKQQNAVVEQLTAISDDAIDPIKAVAGTQGQSERNIQLIHKKHMGYSAKEFNRYQRFLKAIRLIETIASASLKADWFEIVHECGYYDQSQLIHDFQHYIHLSPTNYLRFQQDICVPKI